MAKHSKQGASDGSLSKPEKRNAKFEQEVADSRDHDKQSGKDGAPEKRTKAKHEAPKKH
ncbi:MAG TPA: hypothetical protein VGC19_04865 [Rhodanobacter sp.]